MQKRIVFERALLKGFLSLMFLCALANASDIFCSYNPDRPDRDVGVSGRVGYAKLTNTPLAISEKSETFIGTEVSYYFRDYLGVYVPYEFMHFKASSSHRVGGGFVLRPFCFRHFQTDLFADYAYQRILKQNKSGFGAGANLSWVIPTQTLRILLGPFYKYEQTFFKGLDLKSSTVGFQLQLLGYSDNTF